MVLMAAQSEPSCSITMPGRISLPLILAMAVVCPRPWPASRLRLFPRREPRFRRLLGGGTIFRLLLGGKFIERYIAGTAGLGHEVPLHGVHGIGRNAATGRQHAGEAVLRDGAAAPRRLLQQGAGGGFVLRHAVAVEQRDGIFHLGVEIVGKRGGGKQAARLLAISRHAATFLVERRQRVLRLWITGLRRGLEQLGRAREILSELLALKIEQREIVGRRCMSELGGRREQLGGFVAVLLSPAALEPE